MKFLFLFSLFLIGGCSSTLKAPDPDYANLPEHMRGHSEHLALIYHKATTEKDPIKACEYFSKLESSDDFPLKELVEIKKIKVCNYSDKELEEIWENHEEFSKWIKKSYYQTSYDVAAKRNLKKYIGRFAYRLSFYTLNKQEKETYLQTAIKLDSDPKFNDLAKKRLLKISPRLSEKNDQENLFKVGYDFEKNREFIKARKIYFKLLRKKGLELDENIKLYNRIRFSYKKELDKDKYEYFTMKMYEFLKRTRSKSEKHLKEFFKSVLTYSRVLWTRGHDDKALAILHHGLKMKGLEDEEKSRFFWILGGIKKGQKKLRLARAFFEKSLQFCKKDDPLYQKLVWDIGFSHYLEKSYDKSKEFFEKQLEASEDQYSDSRFKFWYAKSLIALKEKDKANKSFQEIIDNNPLSYYGILAKMELNIPFGPLDPKHDIEAIELPLFDWLVRLNEEEIAKSYLSSVEERRSHKVLPLYARVGFYDKALSTFFSLPPKEQEEVLEEAPVFAFPLAYQDDVTEIATKYDVPPHLLLAISRQESGFNPYARSFADAFGLMQLLPSRAEKLSKSFKIPYRNKEDLYQPETNINLGAALFKSLKAEFENKFPFYVAAYNAGSIPVRTWIKERFTGDILEFIEQIPYRETQHYVKIVLRNFIIYRRLLSEDEFHFPKEIFNG